LNSFNYTEIAVSLDQSYFGAI